MKAEFATEQAKNAEQVVLKGDNFDVILAGDKPAIRINIGGHVIVMTAEQWHAAASVPSETGITEKPCETCNDDPEVCATVPGLRHCEAAMRANETPRTDGVLPSQSFIDETRLFDRHYYLPLIELARNLERELAAMQIAYAALCTRSATLTNQRVAGLGAVTPTSISAVPVAVTNGRDVPAPTNTLLSPQRHNEE